MGQPNTRLPQPVEDAFTLFDKYAGGFGVEMSGSQEDPDEQVHYVNVGDVYSTTLVYYGKELFLTDVGSVLEEIG